MTTTAATTATTPFVLPFEGSLWFDGVADGTDDDLPPRTDGRLDVRVFPDGFMRGDPLPDGLEFYTRTGMLLGRPVLNTAGDYMLNFSVTDRDTGSTIFLTPVTLHISEPFKIRFDKALGRVGQFLELGVADFSGGSPPYIFTALALNGLPLGMYINTTSGQIMGVPQHAMSPSEITVHATDANKATYRLYSVELSIVDEPNMTLWVYPEAAINAQYYFNEPVIIPAAPASVISGGAPPFEFFVADDVQLPEGLRVVKDTGDLSGKPTHPFSTERFSTTYNISLYAVDRTGFGVRLPVVTVAISDRPDCDTPAYGPEGRACSFAEICVDGVPFDSNFTCRCMSSTGDGCWSSVKLAATSAKPSGASHVTITVTSVTVSLLGVILIIAIVAAVVVRRHRRRQRALDCSVANFAPLLEALEAQGLGAIASAPRELPRNAITLLAELGQGAFGMVHKAMLDEFTSTGTPAYAVAVKLLRADANTAEEEALLREACLMAQVRHVNVVGLIGVVTRGRPILVVLQCVLRHRVLFFFCFFLKK
jgi:hypothetical protein